MSLSSSKTVELLVCARKQHTVEPLLIGDQPVQQIKCVKLLGITTDCNLTFKDHVELCRKKAMQRIFWLRTLRRYGGNHIGLLRLYRTCIRSILEYACPAWFPFTSVMLRKIIERIEKCALRAIYPDKNYNDALNTSGMLPILSHLDGIVLNTFKKMLNPDHPLHHLIPVTQRSVSNRETRLADSIRVPPCRLALRRRSFVVYATRMYNAKKR